MSLWAQALAGGIAGAAGSLETNINKDLEQMRIDELARAKELREESFRKLREQDAEKRTIAAEERANKRALSPYYDPDTSAQMTNEEADKWDKSSLYGKAKAEEMFKTDTDKTINGKPATRQQLEDNEDANWNIERAGEQLKAGEISQAEYDEIVSSWQGDAGKVESFKHEEAKLKREADALTRKELEKTRQDAANERAADRNETLRTIAEGNRQSRETIAAMRDGERGKSKSDREAEKRDKVDDQTQADYWALKKNGEVSAEDMKDINARRSRAGLPPLGNYIKDAHTEWNSPQSIFGAAQSATGKQPMSQNRVDTSSQAADAIKKIRMSSLPEQEKQRRVNEIIRRMNSNQ